MASKKLEWILSLVDRMSGPAGSAGKKLAELEKKMRDVDRASMADRLNKTTDPLKREALGLQIEKSRLLEQRRAENSTSGWLANLSHGFTVVQGIGSVMASVASAAASVAETTGRILYNFASSAVEAASFKEQNLIAFRTILGSDAAAERMMKTLVDFAAVTPFETKQIMEMGKNLLVGGFKEQEIPTVLKAVGDVGAMKGFSQEIIDRLVSAMGQVKARGKLTGEAMERFAEAGLPVGKVYEKLGQVLGVTSQQAQKLMSAGRINADTGIFAVIKTIRDDMSGGKLGNMMEQMSGTVQGLWSTLSSKPFEYLMDLDKSGGFGTLKSVLGNAIKALDGYQPRIKETLERVFTGTINAVFGDLASAEGPQRIDAFVQRVLHLLEAVPPAISGFAAGIKAGAGGIFGDIDQLLSGPMTPEKLAKVQASFESLGKTIGDAVSGAAKLASYIGDIADVVKFLAKLSPLYWAAQAGEPVGKAVTSAGRFADRLVGASAGYGWKTQDEARAEGLLATPEQLALMEQDRLEYARGPNLESVAGNRSLVYSPNVTNNNTFTGAAADDPAAAAREVGKATSDVMSEWDALAVTSAVGS